MKLLLLYLLALFAYSAFAANRPVVRPRAVPLLVICLVLAVGYTARRLI